MRITRRKFIATAGAGFVATGGSACYARYIEPEHFELTHKRISLRAAAPALDHADGGNAAPVARTTAAVAPATIRILHLADFHLSKDVTLGFIDSAIEAGLAEKPDLVCLTGDFITSTLEGESAYATVLRKLSASHPTFASPGNHDGGRWAANFEHGYPTLDRVRALLAAAQIDFLVNERRHLTVRGRDFVLAGLADILAGNLAPERALDSGAGSSDARLPTIVLSHNPDSKSAVASYAWDLMLCGHTHGGQIRVPFTNFRPFLPVADKTMDEGLHVWSGRQIQITRGVGNLYGIRFNCPPEVSVLDVEL